MEFSVVSEETVSRSVEVRVPSEDVEAEINRVLQRLAGRVKIKGFRPGKVPLREVRRRHGAAARADAIEALVQKSLSEALRDDKLKGTVHVTAVEVTSGPKGGDLEFVFSAERMPEVTPSGYLKPELKVPRTEVTDDDVNEAVERLREEHERLEPVEDREKVEEGDVVVASYRARGEGDVEQIFADDQEIRLFDENLPEGLAAGIVGAVRGEALDVTIKLPKEFSVDELAGAEVVLDLTVSEIKKRVLPELDDAFAKEAGEGETLLELRLKVREGLESERKKLREDASRRALMEKLREANPLELPDGYVRTTAMEEARNQLGRSLRPEDFQKQEIRPLLEAFARQMEDDVRRSIHEMLLLREIAKAEKVEVADADIDAWMEKVSGENNLPLPRLRAQYSSPDARESLKSRLLFDKVTERLLSDARLVEVDPAELEEDAKGDEATGKDAGDDEQA